MVADYLWMNPSAEAKLRGGPWLASHPAMVVIRLRLGALDGLIHDSGMPSMGTELTGSASIGFPHSGHDPDVLPVKL